jgi:hypothetical protein
VHNLRLNAVQVGSGATTANAICCQAGLVIFVAVSRSMPPSARPPEAEGRIAGAVPVRPHAPVDNHGQLNERAQGRATDSAACCAPRWPWRVSTRALVAAGRPSALEARQPPPLCRESNENTKREVRFDTPQSTLSGLPQSVSALEDDP